jgi:hypothetical protein
VARVLALAHHWQGLIRAGVVRNQAELARLVGVSRARVTQVLDLLRLAPVIQAAVLDTTRDRTWNERSLRALAQEPLWCRQCRFQTAEGPSPIATLHARGADCD